MLYVGIDRASDHHDVCLTNDSAQTLAAFRIAHSSPGWLPEIFYQHEVAAGFVHLRVQDRVFVGRYRKTHIGGTWNRSHHFHLPGSKVQKLDEILPIGTRFWNKVDSSVDRSKCAHDHGRKHQALLPATDGDPPQSHGSR